MSGGPGQLLTGIAGAVVGFVASGFNPYGAAVGFSLGTTAGGIIWPMDGGTQHGPRLADKEVQSSTYGASIPVIYGSYRTAGNVIWAKDIEERADFKRVGKTLFSKGTKVWSYTYYGHFAIGVCEGPVTAIGRIWADGKLLHDPDAEGKYDKYVRKYLGTEDQMPDPDIQADKGIDQTPAFRGLAYVVLTGLPLADWGNRLPSISIEVGGVARAAEWHDGSVTNVAGDWSYTQAQPYRVANTWSNYVTVVDTRTLVPWQFVPVDYRRQWLTGGNTEGAAAEPPEGYIDPIGYATTELFGDIYGPGVDSTNYTWPAIDPASGDVIVFLQGVTSRSAVTRWRVTGGYPMLVYVRAFYTDTAVGANWVFGNRVWMVDQFQSVTYCIDIATGAEVWRHDHGAELTPSPSIYDSILAATYRAGDGSVYFVHVGEASHSGGASLAGGRIVRQSLATGAILGQAGLSLPADAPFSAVYDAATDRVIIIHDGGFLKVDPVSLAVVESVTMATPWVSSGTQMRVQGIDNAVSGSLWLTDGNASFWQVSTTDFGTIWTGTTDPAVRTQGGGMGHPFHIVSSRPMVFGYAGGTQTYRFATETRGTNLAAIITDICDRCELEAGDIDVSELVSQSVDGYGVLRESTGRAALEPLLSAYAVDAPERDGLLRFPFRKTATLGAIPFDDLGASGDGSPAVRVTERRRQEVELPSGVVVTYSSMALDYASNTQSAKRIDDTHEAGDPRSQEFPLVLSDADANTLASRLLYLAWIERTSYSVSLPPKWLVYDAGDVLDLPLESSSVRMLVTRAELGGDGIVRLEGLATDAYAYLPPPDAAVVPIFSGQTVPGVQVMRLVALDAPLLSDDDDTPGFYAGGDGTAPDWAGGAVYASQNDVDYEQAASVAEPSPIGVAGTALAAHTSALLDRSSVLRVFFDYDVTLSSITELELLAGGNLAMLGSELIGFATATRIGAGVYDLSLLRRGVQGTEWAASHTGGDRFVLLDNVQSVDLPLTELGQVEYLKAVSLGDTLDDVSAETFTPAGVRLKPLSPVHITGSRAGDDLAVTWVRRARVDADWRDLLETPLDEPAEAYELDVLDGSTVVRTISTSSPNATYDAAAQTADFGAPQASVSVKVYQLSSRVGRGYPGSATL